MVEMIKDQKTLCASEQCSVQLDEEIVALSERTNGAIAHVEAVLHGAELDQSRVRKALVMIASRADSMGMLRKAA